MLAASAHSDAGGQCAATDPPFLLTCPIHPGRLAVVVEVVVMYYKAREDREPLMGLRFGAAAAPTA